MDYDFFAILLLLVGFILIVAEVFIPSGGMILIMCTIAFGGSLWCAVQAWYGTHPIAFGSYVTSLIVLIPTVVIGSFRIFPMTPFGRRLMSVPTLEEVTPHLRERQHLAEFVGRVAEAITPLMPGGLVRIDSERLHAFSEGVIIEQGTPVEIVEVRGTRVVVRKADPELLKREQESTPSSDNLVTDSDTSDDEDGSSEPPLDFAVPQG
ncbi:MAG: hypothetical protein KDA93_10890 [Planctomycetaceae bacterium]|nr:hypothetical protein [Planctomycetaceae bacterium]